MKLKLQISLFFVVVFFQSCFCQEYWNDSTTLTNTRENIINQIWIIDTIAFPLSQAYVRNINSKGQLHNVAEFLSENRDLSIKLTCLLNKEYDTTSSHWLRTKSHDYYKSLIYFNVSPESIQCIDSVFSNQSESGKLKIAERKVLAEFHINEDCEKLKIKFNEAFLLNNEDKLNSIFEELLKNNSIPRFDKKPLLERYKINALIDLFYKDFFRYYKKSKFTIIPFIYPVELGEIERITSDEEYLEDIDAIIPAFDFTSSRYSNSYLYEYKVIPDYDNHLFQTEGLRIGLQEFLGYDFEFKLDSMTNTPSSFVMVNKTKEKFDFISKYLFPKHEYLVRDYCNTYMFWDHHWELQAPYTIKKIQIDINSYTAFITFKNDKLEENIVTYKLIDGKWINNEPNKYNRKVILAITILLGLISIVILIRKKCITFKHRF